MEKKRSNITVGILLVLTLLTGTYGILFSQTSSEHAEFLIRLETTDKGIRLDGWHGCAFKELHVTLKDSVRKTIDQYGRVSFVRFSTKGIPGEGLAVFQFAVMKTEEGLCFEGIHGTAWETLSIAHPESTHHWLIDQNGINDYLQQTAAMD